jgi:hypothetical protein
MIMNYITYNYIIYMIHARPHVRHQGVFQVHMAGNPRNMFFKGFFKYTCYLRYTGGSLASLCGPHDTSIQWQYWAYSTGQKLKEFAVWAMLMSDCKGKLYPKYVGGKGRWQHEMCGTSGCDVSQPIATTYGSRVLV